MKAKSIGVRAQVWLGLAAVLALASAANARAATIEVGQSAPAFQLPDENGRMRSLMDYKGRTLVLAFYPKDFTGG